MNKPTISKVHKGIQAPKDRKQIVGKGAELRLILEKLQRDECIDLTGFSPTYVHFCANQAGIKITARKMPNGTLRVWRLFPPSTTG